MSTTDPLACALAVEIAGERLLLDGDRALIWPARRTVIIADVHFGKAQFFRERGVPLPAGDTDATLARIDALLQRHDATRLLVVGDLVHGATRAHANWIVSIRQWRAARPALDALVVRGNHDRHVDPTRLGFGAVAGPWRDGALVFDHDPDTDPADGHLIAGHLHPGVRLSERFGAAIRLPAFWIGPRRTVLPAFGALTGFAPFAAAADDAVYACARGRIVRIARRTIED